MPIQKDYNSKSFLFDLCTEVLNQKPSSTIIYDTDSIISILENSKFEIFKDFTERGITNTYISPVGIELTGTNSSLKRFDRSFLLREYFDKEPYLFKNKSITDYIQPIQLYLLDHQIEKASPTDIYLAATIAYYTRNKQTYLLTGNIQHFPLPLFTRHGYIVLQNKKDIRTLCFLRVNLNELEEFKEDIKI